ncbi:lytic transglycosylase domain-containing protein [Streptomyces fuscigenes]|uniref:lytic transglycosylase domain-containing protein n=1 Tax=Streptomyces fuscigenes TaxID=1528880 RepID=UPI001F229A03|nr:lytic transglycosylase domain-containing protein [Streptomyces fuscigenes]MCF3963662.1 lytic transglycosylase domain-containing protein [Streptomyces fuscigenes]
MAALFGRRLRRGATTTAVAAVAIAALSASQAPGLTAPLSGTDASGRQSAGDAQDTTPDTASGNSQYYTDLPPLDSPTPSTGTPGTDTVTGAAESGIPATVLAAYKQAEQELRQSSPQCHLPWQLLAAIGKVESGQARGGAVDANGTTLRPILGPVLDGNGFANITDTDHGLYDQDTVHDRAVGPMQFIPSTWQTWGRDANHDGVKDPNNIFDAALATGSKLCASNHDMTVQSDMNAAILSYNQSQEYLHTVLSWYEYYRKGTHEIPDGTGTLPSSPGPLDPTPSTSPSVPLPTYTPTNTPSSTPDPGHSTAPHSGGTAPSKPHKPADPGKPDDPGTPSDPGTPGGGTTTPPATADPVLKSLVKTAGDGLKAVADALFGGHAQVRAVDDAGKPMPGVTVTFQIVGDTDAHFDGGSAKATATTGKDGTANAPAVRAGADTGAFTVRATAGEAPAVDFKATVTPHSADALVYLGDDQSAAAGDTFEKALAVKATLGGAAAAKVAVSAAVLDEDGSPATAGHGPAFKNADGTLVQTLSGLTTGADGTLTLPALVAGTDPGTYQIKLTAEGGGSVTVTVKVVAATSPSDPPSGDPSGDPSGSPSASPSA